MSQVPLSHYQTHDVVNQSTPLVDYNLYTTDRALREWTLREGGAWGDTELTTLGAKLGSSEVIEWGFLANRHLPTLHTFDRFGRRRDQVEYHPAWHNLLGLSMANGLHSSPWADPKPGAHVARAAGLRMLVEIEAGVMCPTTVCYAAIPTLRAAPTVGAEWTPRMLSRQYDPRFIPAKHKTSAIVSMGMTEKQGGTDLRTNSTRAAPDGPNGEYLVTGHKWFFSIPMSDAFLITAQAPGGLSCFLMPRFRPDGSVNALHLQRLKDKLGNRANASSEVEFHEAHAVLVGPEGRGIATIIEMTNYCRLDCALGSSGVMRQALAQALHHAERRCVFGRPILEQPLMMNVLADLAIESEAATALVMRLAAAYDRQSDPYETMLRRVVTAAIKFWICKRVPVFTGEALEVFGGGGFVEESIMPRLYREAPLNSVWEGCGNVMCLDVQRALDKTEGGLDALITELGKAKGSDKRYDAFATSLEHDLRARKEMNGRRLVERIALALSGALLTQHAPHAVADAFCASRLAGGWTGAFGTLEGGDFRAIIDRARPV